MDFSDEVKFVQFQLTRILSLKRAWQSTRTTSSRNHLHLIGESIIRLPRTLHNSLGVHQNKVNLSARRVGRGT